MIRVKIDPVRKCKQEMADELLPLLGINIGQGRNRDSDSDGNYAEIKFFKVFNSSKCFEMHPCICFDCCQTKNKIAFERNL